MKTTVPLGSLIHSFFTDHLVTIRGLRPASIHSYRDTVQLLLLYAAREQRTKITKLTLANLTFDTVQGFLRYLEAERGNHIRTRNQRLAVLHSLFEYIATREPTMLDVCQRVQAIPMKRVAPAETHYLERDEIESLFAELPTEGRFAVRDRALLMFLYNTGARAQEVADLRTDHLNLDEVPLVRLHGKGDKWRTCPLWQRTATLLCELTDTHDLQSLPRPVFIAANGEGLTRSGIYKIVRRHAGHFDNPVTGRRIGPHLFRHTAAMHLLEAGVDINVIRGWLGHVDLSTTNRYAEINTRTKIEALKHTEPPIISAESRQHAVWRTDENLLNWLSSL